MILPFLNDYYFYVYIPVGLIALLMGVDRAVRKEEEESKKLQTLGGISGLILLALTVIVSINDYEATSDIITNYSILFGLLLGMSLIARPFKNLPLAFIVSVIVMLGFMYVFIVNREEVNSIGTVPLRIILIVVLVIVFLIFLISFVQEQAIDGLLWVLGWGPIITFLGLAILAQGITILIDFPPEANGGGILWYLPG